jgi:hypothetical protein
MGREEFYENVCKEANNQIKTGFVGLPDGEATINMAVVGHILKVAFNQMKGMSPDEIMHLVNSG